MNKKLLKGLLGVGMAILLAGCAASIKHVDGDGFKAAAVEAGYEVQDYTDEFQAQVGDQVKVDQGYYAEGDDGSFVQFVDFENEDDAKTLYSGWKSATGISEDDAKSQTEQNLEDNDIYTVADATVTYRIIRTEDTVMLGAAEKDSADMMNKTMDALGK